MGWLPLLWVATAALAGPAGPVRWGPTAFLGGGWGRMIEDADGSWLAVTTRYPPGTNSYLRISRSMDHARSWTTLAEIREPGRTLDNGELVRLPEGTLLLTMRSLIAGQSYRLPVYASRDGGRTWSYRSTIDSSEGAHARQGRGLWEPDFWVLEDGRLVVTYSNEKHEGYSQLISLRLSEDGGTSWGPEQWAVAPPKGSKLRPGMSQLTRMANGEYLLVYEVVNSGRADVHGKVSTDALHWPSGLGTRIPCQHCGPFVTALSNGLVVVTSCENEVSFSEDFGRTWQRIAPPAWPLGYAHTWPAVYQTQSNELAVMVVHHGVRLRFGTLLPHPRWPNPWQEDFDDGADDGWTRYGGRFELRNGQYLLDNRAAFGMALTGDAFWSDGTLEADLMLGSPGSAGLMFRTTNPDYEDPNDASGYYAGLDTAGLVLLGRMDNAWTPLAQRAFPVRTNLWYRLKLTMAGSNLRLFVNDAPTPHLSVVDTNHLRGQIGLRTVGCSARFDNVVFSNAAPPRLSLRREAGGWELSWPETAVNVRLYTTTDLRGPAASRYQAPRLAGRSWRLLWPVAPEPRRFFWLQVE